MTFDPAGERLVPRRCGAYRLDRIGSRSELVGCYMRHHCGLAGRIRGVPCWTAKPTGGCHRVAA